jgi:hypothetical protein
MQRNPAVAVESNHGAQDIFMTRKKVAFLFGTPPDFDVQALKYFILSLNKIQSLYEFIFPDLVGYLYSGEDHDSEDMLDKLSQIAIKLPNVSDYWISIVNLYLKGNIFSDSSENCSVITTYSWQKYFAPPSLFEYLLNGSVACLIFMNHKIDIDCHSDTRGCILDFTRLKSDDRVDIAMGYICDDDKRLIIDALGKKYYMEIISIIDRHWIGSTSELHSVAYNLKRYFKFDIEEDTGLNKSIYEKIKDSFYEIPVNVILLLFGALISIILFLIGIK